jgi:catechol 2,3-dioxygenase
MHPSTMIGAVHLVVRRLDQALAFYRDVLGFTELARRGDTVTLGAGGRPHLVLEGRADAPAPGVATGLYHLAILLPSRGDLARALRNLAQRRVPLHGASDHAVSEALYLADPEGNGIEIYRDRPAAEWRRDDGTIHMTTTALDLDGLLAEPGAGDAWRLPEATRIGHVHLKVNDVAAAERFYVDVLGFDLMARYGHRASFVSAGGYHHHIGFNSWESAGAPPPPRGAAGLAAFEIVLPHRDALEAVLARLKEHGTPAQSGEGGHRLTDPSGNGVLLLAA